MSLDEPWVWLAAVLAGWVFLGLAAGRFDAYRRRALHSESGGGKSGQGVHDRSCGGGMADR